MNNLKKELNYFYKAFGDWDGFSPKRKDWEVFIKKETDKAYAKGYGEAMAKCFRDDKEGVDKVSKEERGIAHIEGYNLTKEDRDFLKGLVG